MPPIIHPLGIGDLKVVKQKLARYEAGEVAHIENVQAREKRLRQHRRLRQIEETIEREQEREEESRRDLQSTERFEMQRETERTAKSETSFEAGLELSASYGPVSLSAHADFATSDSTEEANRNATTYAKEVTEKTLSRLVDRVREERKARTLEEVEEKNEHGFDNTEGEENYAGIYRWVDKYYRAKVVNYGRRLLYEFFVPEPAAFYLFATKYNFENKVLPEKPDPPVVPGTSTPLAPNLITRTNYLSLVKQHAADGVTPPPPTQVVVAIPFARDLANAHTAFVSTDLDVPEGYRADYGAYSAEYTWEGNPRKSGGIKIGLNRIDVGNYPSLNFSGETGKVPISVSAYGLKTISINIEAICELIPEYFEKWRLDTYSAIMTAYNKALMEYEERIAAAQIQQGVKISGNNPAINREIEKTELKKSCITMWSSFAFNHPNGINHFPNLALPNNFPELNQTNAIANSERMRFLEEVFEWTNLSFELYPYYWGRKRFWLETYSIESTDPVFEQFLKAGAARVLVPVKPSMTDAVLYYQLTGTIWSGGPVPSLSTIPSAEAGLYAGYVEEMGGVPDLPDIERDVDILPVDPDTWLMKVPTTLVWLQGDSTLPAPEPAPGP
jgi:hypothetical protein